MGAVIFSSMKQELGDAPEGRRASPDQGEFPVLDRRCQLEQPPQDLLRLDAGERGAGAEMQAMAERQMRPGRPAEVETVRVRERGRVPVCRAEAHAGGELHGTVVAEELLDGHGQPVRVAPELPGGARPPAGAWSS